LEGINYCQVHIIIYYSCHPMSSHFYLVSINHIIKDEENISRYDYISLYVHLSSISRGTVSSALGTLARKMAQLVSRKTDWTDAKVLIFVV
jgi:hypothetical protein